ncbi:MAG: transposase [Planctomycetaceae bacterium]|jgi:REP element-mobilizing transposase RayT
MVLSRGKPIQLDHPVYLLTWTTYGSWLHGDQRGSIDLQHNLPLTPVLPAHTGRRKSESSTLKTKPVLLDKTQRAIVSQTIRKVVEHKCWRLHALNCRSNHVHVVILASDRTPEIVMNSLKSWSSRRLNEQLGEKRRWWTRHGSTRYLNDKESVHRAIDYVLNRQDDLHGKEY